MREKKNYVGLCFIVEFYKLYYCRGITKILKKYERNGGWLKV
jgi:hypothetical protein